MALGIASCLAMPSTKRYPIIQNTAKVTQTQQYTYTIIFVLLVLCQRISGDHVPPLLYLPTSTDTMPKISDQRQDELRRLRDLKNSIRDKLEAQRDTMMALQASMSDAISSQLQSSSDASKSVRKIQSSGMTMKDEVQALSKSIERLEEDYKKADDELKQWEEWSKS